MLNRFNRLSSKEWLPFQKSWFRYSDEYQFLLEHVLFFSKAGIQEQGVFYSGKATDHILRICNDANIELITDQAFDNQHLQYAIIDVRQQAAYLRTLQDYLDLRSMIIDLAIKLYPVIESKRFLTVFIPNVFIEQHYLPASWDLAYQLSSIFSLKDEKIACCTTTLIAENTTQDSDTRTTFYCLNFRKDENSTGLYQAKGNNFLNFSSLVKGADLDHRIPVWFILKPTPRSKNEFLHPAKYPEDLVTMFCNQFSLPGENVFDPMTGTGSTQVAALKSGRNAYGTELNSFFIQIARQRCEEIIRPRQQALFLQTLSGVDFKLITKDARLITEGDFPIIHYMITSPPYWDMLNMKGAENQAKRKEKGLQTNYSESEEDLGNIKEYEKFLYELRDIYFNIASLMQQGSCLTIVVKNIKKKGKNYPFAWDLSNLLMERLTLLPETFWCQDDINLAPYGYGNTFVSNTFHQYCLTFKKPG